MQPSNALLMCHIQSTVRNFAIHKNETHLRQYIIMCEVQNCLFEKNLLTF